MAGSNKEVDKKEDPASAETGLADFSACEARSILTEEAFHSRKSSKQPDAPPEKEQMDQSGSGAEAAEKLRRVLSDGEVKSKAVETPRSSESSRTSETARTESQISANSKDRTDGNTSKKEAVKKSEPSEIVITDFRTLISTADSKKSIRADERTAVKDRHSDSSQTSTAQNERVDKLLANFLKREEKTGNPAPDAAPERKRETSLKELQELIEKNPALKAKHGQLVEKLTQLNQQIREKGKEDPGVQKELNELRTQFIVKDLGPQSKPADFKKAAEALKREEDAGNTKAADWGKWAKANEQIASISDSSSSLSGTSAVRNLADMMKEGNPYARTALSAILLSSAPAESINRWLESFPQQQEKPLLVPNIAGLDREGLKWMISDAANAYTSYEARETFKNNPVSRAEIAALSAAVASSDKLGKEYTDKLNLALQGTLQINGGSDEAYQGILDAARFNVPGAEKLMVPYLRLADQYPSFGKTLPEVEKMAMQQNPAALRILAAVAGGFASRSSDVNPPGAVPAHERATKILETIGSRPGMRAEVVKSILEVQARSNSQREGSIYDDSHGRLNVLGKIANGLNPQSDAKLIEEVRKSFSDSLKTVGYALDERPGRVSEGLLQMHRHLKPEDMSVALKTRPLKAESLEPLLKAQDQLSPELRNAFIAGLQDVITNGHLRQASAENSSSQPDRQSAITAMKALAALAKHLDKEQVEFIASFGNNSSIKQDGKLASENLRSKGYDENQTKALQAAAAEGLLNVMARSASSADGQTGPREAAFAAFRNSSWPISDGNGGFVPSNRSEQVKEALLKYYQGHPADAAMAGEINKIVDSARIPRPASEILRQFGIADRANPNDPQLKDKAEQIVKNYDSAKESGEEVLRRVTSNVEMLNTLPAHDRARLMGWTDLPEDQKSAMGWMKEPPEQLKATVNWDQLSEQEKEGIRWQAVRLDGTQVLGQMYNGQLEHSDNNALLKDLTGQIEAMRQGRQKEVELQTSQLTQLQRQREQTMSDLDAQTRQGVSFGSKVVNVFNNGRDADFDRQQSAKLDQLKSIDENIKQTQRNLQTAELHQNQLALAKDVGDFQRLVNTGNQSEADKLAMRLLQQHGPSLSVLAPGLWRELSGGPDNPGIMKRLADRGLAQSDQLPSYTAGSRDNLQESELGLKQALGLEASENGSKLGLIQLKPDENLLDSKALRSYMTGRIDSDPVLSKFSAIGNELNGPLSDLSKMFSAAQSGTIYENFIEGAKDRAGKVKEMMDKVTVEDMRALEGRIKTMSDALKEMKNVPSSHNAEAVKELEDRINSFKNMHNMLNKFDPAPKYPEVIQKQAGETELSNPNKNMRQMVDMILDNALQPSTLGTWMSQNGLVIAATIGAAAATIATIGTFGAASPLAAAAYTGLAIAVTGLAAREITTEVLYQINKDGYTGFGHYGEGSRFGNFARASLDRSAVENLKSLGLDVLLPYTGEVVRDWAAFMVMAGVVSRVMGGSPTMKESFSNLFKTPPANMPQLAFAAERAAAMEAGTSQSASFMRQYMTMFQRELLVNSGFAAAQISGEQTIQAAMGKELVNKMGAWGQFGLSFGVSTAIALGQGYRHARYGQGSSLLADAQMKAGNRLEFKLTEGVREADFIDHMRRQGFDVKAGTAGKFEVRPFNAGADFTPIIMENVSHRGIGKPNLELAPTGENLALRTPEANASNPHINDLRAISESFMKGDFHKAIALSADGLNSNGSRVVSQELAFDLAAYRRAPEQYMRDFMGRMGEHSNFRPSENGSKPEVKLSAPTISTDNAKVNLLNGEVTFKGQHEAIKVNPATGLVELPQGRKTPAHLKAEQEFKAARDSLDPKHYQRLLAEQAIIQMEERLHSRQGAEPISPSRSDFLRDMNIKEEGNSRSAASREQEIILALHDAGWPASLIEHHFGQQHVSDRRAAMDFIKAKEALSKIADSTDREFLQDSIRAASPEARKLIMEKLPDLLAHRFKNNALELTETLDKIKSIGGQDTYTLSRVLSEIPKEHLSDPAIRDILTRTIEESGVNNSLLDAAAQQRAQQTLRDTVEKLDLPPATKQLLLERTRVQVERPQAVEAPARTLTPEQEAIIQKAQNQLKQYSIAPMSVPEFSRLVREYGLQIVPRNGQHNSDIVDGRGNKFADFGTYHTQGVKMVKGSYRRNLLNAIIESVKSGTFHPKP